MNRAFSTYSFFLTLFLLVILHHVQPAEDVVQDTCKKLVGRDPELDFNFCVKSLDSVPKSHGADFERLGLIGVKLLQANLTGTIEYIKQLVKQEREPNLLNALLLYLDVYTSTDGEDMTPAYKAKRYFDVSIRASAVSTHEDICDTQELQKKGMVSPLTKSNHDIDQLSRKVLSITAIL